MHSEWNAFQYDKDLQGEGKKTSYHYHEPTGAYATYDDPMDSKWEEANKEMLNGWTRETFAASHGFRGLTLREFFLLKAEIEKTPLPVRLVVPEAPEWDYRVDLYQPKLPRDEHGEQIYPPLLMVQIVPLHGFPDLMGPNGKIPEGTVDYHISLCFTNELGRVDLYNWNEGIRRGLDIYEGFRQRLDGKNATARVRIATGGAVDILSLKSPGVGDLMEDPVLTALHNAGRYWDRPMHISM